LLGKQNNMEPNQSDFSAMTWSAAGTGTTLVPSTLTVIDGNVSWTPINSTVNSVPPTYEELAETFRRSFGPSDPEEQIPPLPADSLFLFSNRINLTKE